MIDLNLEYATRSVKVANEHKELTIFFIGSMPAGFVLESLPASGCYVAHCKKEGVRRMPAGYDFQIQNVVDFRDKLRYALRVVVGNG